jgi:hypothetical protein
MDLRELETAFKTHEAQCEERWKTIFERVDANSAHLLRIENRMLAIGGTIIVFLLGIVASSISFGV